MTMTRRRLRKRNRAARVVIGADLPPYEPKTGDIVTAFFRFSKETVTGGLPDQEDPDHGRPQPDPKFRTCLVLKPKGKPPVLVPISSSPDRQDHHVPITDHAEQDACDLREGQDAYAKVLEARRFHLPSPLIQPSEVAQEDGSIGTAWVIGKAPEALLKRVQAEMLAQSSAERIKGFFEEKAGEIPEHTLKLMRGTAKLAREHLESVQQKAASRARAARPEPSAEAKVPAAADAAPAALQTKARTVSPEQMKRQMVALRAARAQEAADKLARSRGEHPEQTAPARANADALARKRGTHPDQVAARRAERGPAKPLGRDADDD